MSYRLPVLIRDGEDGYVIASCPVIPGCTTQGRTRADALQNLHEAIALALECQATEGWSLPTSFEWTEISASV